jgi:riboflavin kinase/FMN adenylyltransferase
MTNIITKISGVVIKGKQKGRQIGFPTANISLTECKFESGVYVGKTVLDGKEYTAAIFVPDSGDLLEAHILDFEGDLYGEEMEIEIGQKIREVVRFESEKDLISQILKDLFQIRKSKI